MLQQVQKNKKIGRGAKTYVEPRKKARERLNPNKKTDTTAVSSIATEVEYTCNDK